MSRVLAVGLDNQVFLWSERGGVKYPRRPGDNQQNVHVTSLSFSSAMGKNSILAIGRSSGLLSIWSLADIKDRFTCNQPNPISCVSFKPVTTKRRSKDLGLTVPMEELLVGDELGMIYHYSIEWETQIGADGGSGNMNLLAKIDIHSQQICGIVWSPSGDLFATGGNDNLLLLFVSADVLQPSTASRDNSTVSRARSIPSTLVGPTLSITPYVSYSIDVSGASINLPVSDGVWPPHLASSDAAQSVVCFSTGAEHQRWMHSAAIKAIAFCPWQRGLVAAGGGSNDRAIHFYHAWSGACLATINVQAQVTSLIWSRTRREIAATFGYTQPEHPYRIAVFSWPECQQVLAIPWTGDMRALYAISYPGGPNDPRSRRSGEGEVWWQRTQEEGSIVVASSDESVKFHEIWSERCRGTSQAAGGLGWSDILEGLEGVDKEGPVIR